jgi:hypothetical protein
MQLRMGSKTTAGAAAAWLALALVLSARFLGAPIPPRALAVLAAAALVVSAVASLRTIASAWRGPVIVSFRRREAVLCDPLDADAVRAGAQLRGTMGGAGHVHRARLAFPALAWAAAAFLAGTVALDPSLATVPTWAAGATVCAALAAALLPARSFFYREVIGGCVIVHPPEACIRLLDSREVAGAGPAASPEGAPDGDPRDGASDRWGNSRNLAEPRAECPPADAPSPR